MNIKNKIKKACETLGEIEPGFLPLPVFRTVERLAVWGAIEIIPMRVHEGKIQILMYKRPADDPFWANKWHTPGTMVRPTDGSVKNALVRLLKYEMYLPDMTDELHFIKPIFHDAVRGFHLALLYWIELKDDEYKEAVWYNYDETKDINVSCNLEMNKVAVEAFKKAKG